MLVFKVLLFVFMVGSAIGGLLIAPRERVRPQQIIFFIIFFIVLCYIGMIIGMFLFSWISVRLLEYILSVVLLFFIVACVTRFHPTLGFFHSGDRLLLLLLTIVFFLMGLEWGLLGLRPLFTILSSVLFTVSIAVGAIIQLQIRQTFWRYMYTSFTPLVWLFFSLVLKLV